MSDTATMMSRKYPVGAEVTEEGIHFRVWAPSRQTVRVKVNDREAPLPLQKERGGYFSGWLKDAGAGLRYGFLLDDEDFVYPDPTSRFQPDGVHEMSEVIDPRDFRWNDANWRGIELRGQVIYELHLGCFTPAGTWRAAAEKLGVLRDLGVTTIEVMPVADFAGDFGWGYDGVCWFAPTRLYGRPNDFRYFVDTAHQLGLAVILDVVYNHFGPAGNYLGAFSPHVISQKHSTEWGDALNYDGEGANGVREFVISNAAYWIDEYHLDGLRLDATQSIFDDSSRHLLADLSTAARRAAGNRNIIIVAENDQRDIRHVEPQSEGGFGLDGLWNDDFHHSCRVAATGHAEYYYQDFTGSAQELLSAVRWGYLFQGQYSSQAKAARGTASWHASSWRFVSYLQNHDQVANSAHGLRLPDLTSPGTYRALTTLWLLSPSTPMLFMGQEFGTRAPFVFFADHEVELAKLVREGRWESLRQFPRIAGWEGGAPDLPDPSVYETYQRCKLDWEQCSLESPHWRLHQDLLQLRREDRTISQSSGCQLHGAVVNDQCFILRWLHLDPVDALNDRLLLFNLGRDYRWTPNAEPLLAPPARSPWKILFSSEDERYGGSGTALLGTSDWHLPGHAAILLSPNSDQARTMDL